jgi:PKHD-type hydroxylase|tara:strand:+ start:345 stop:974 length:630 start_codon:yes stop_codon:yes gene_type:complete
MSISKYQYAIYNRAIPIKVCNDIIKYGLAEKGNLGTIYATGNNIKDIKNNTSKATKLLEKRDSNISWLNCPWVHKIVHPWVWDAMKKFDWNYDLIGAEKSQFTVYHPGQFYDWHQDCFFGDDIKTKHKGRNRKISYSLLLNDPSEYEGGELQFDIRNQENSKNNKIETVTSKDQGTLIIFPSFSFHRVLPVKHGVRYSLVTWFQGPDWR